MKLSGVHHVSLNVGDLEKAAPFYTDILGLKVLPRPDFGFPGLWLGAQGQEIHLIQTPDHVAPKGQHFAFKVDDLDETVEELKRHGLAVRGPFDIPGVTARQAFTFDPSGNMIEFNQPE